MSIMKSINNSNITLYQNPIDNGITSTIRLYLPPILLVLGFISNPLLYFVFGREKFKNFNIIVYIRVFAVSNIVVLCLGVGVEWICYIVGHPGIFTLSDVMCRLWMFALNVITHAPVWFVVSMSVDRFVYIWYPNKAMDMCNFFIAKIVVVVSIVGLIAVSVHALWTFELDPLVGCYMPSIQSFHYLAWPWFSDSFFIFIPIILLLIFCTVDLIGLIVGVPSFSSCLEKQTTQVVILMAACFLSLETPAAIIKIVGSTIPKSWLENRDFLRTLFVGQAVCQILASLNQFILVLVPAIWMRDFNKECLQMINSCRKRPFSRKPSPSVALNMRSVVPIETVPEEEQPMTAGL